MQAFSRDTHPKLHVFEINASKHIAKWNKSSRHQNVIPSTTNLEFVETLDMKIRLHRFVNTSVFVCYETKISS